MEYVKWFFVKYAVALVFNLIWFPAAYYGGKSQFGFSFDRVKLVVVFLIATLLVTLIEESLKAFYQGDSDALFLVIPIFVDAFVLLVATRLPFSASGGVDGTN